MFAPEAFISELATRGVRLNLCDDGRLHGRLGPG